MAVYLVYDTTRAAIYTLDWPVATLPIPFRIRGGYVADTDNSLSVPKRDLGCQHARTPTHPGSTRRPTPWAIPPTRARMTRHDREVTVYLQAVPGENLHAKPLGTLGSWAMTGAVTILQKGRHYIGR